MSIEVNHISSASGLIGTASSLCGLLAAWVFSRALGWADVWDGARIGLDQRFYLLLPVFSITALLVYAALMILIGRRRRARHEDPSHEDRIDIALSDTVDFQLLSKSNIKSIVAYAITLCTLSFAWGTYTELTAFSLLSLHGLVILAGTLIVYAGTFGSSSVSDRGMSLRPIPGIVMFVRAEDRIVVPKELPNGNVGVEVRTGVGEVLAKFELDQDEAAEVLDAWDRHRRLVHALQSE